MFVMSIFCFKYDIYSLGIILFELYTDFNTEMERFKLIELFKSKKINKLKKLYPLISNRIDERPNINFLANNFSLNL